MGQKESRKIPAKFPTKFPKFPCEKSKKIHRRASAGTQGEGKGSETPLFPMLEHEERGSLRPFFPSQEGVSDPFSHRKRENPVHPKIPLAKIPLAQRTIVAIKGVFNNEKDPPVQARKRNQNPNFVVRISSGGLGVFHMKGLGQKVRYGGGAKKFGMSSESQGNQTFWRDIPGCWRDIPRAPKKFEKKEFVFNLRTLLFPLLRPSILSVEGLGF